MTRVPRVAVVATAFALLLLPLAACASPASSDDAEAPVSSEAPADESGDAAASGEMYGCTDATLAYAEEFGYPDAAPLDPATIDIPETDFDIAPTCYLIDETGGYERHAAFWADDPEATLSTLGGALDAAGYQQSDDYGPQVWWINGEEPMSAEHAIGAAVQPELIDERTMLWATW